jgi:hypothetical protein
MQKYDPEFPDLRVDTALSVAVSLRRYATRLSHDPAEQKRLAQATNC